MISFKRFLWKTRLGGNIVKTFDTYKRLQWLKKEEMKALQQDHLKKLLIHSYQHVPYYRWVLHKSDVMHDGHSVNLQNFSCIPLLDKSLIHNNCEKLKSDDLSKRRWYENSSGGTTGESVRFVQDKTYRDISMAVKILNALWSGHSFSDRKIVLWGSIRDSLIGQETLRTNLGRWLRNEIWLNAYRMTKQQMHSHVKLINDFRPIQILAYAESIHELSQFIRRENLRVHSPRSIMTSAGMLYPHMRETIEQVFQSPVFNRYGSREVGDIACECDNHRGLHISPFTHYVEILRQDCSPAAPGEIGEIVITLLTNYAMPVIRYRIGDKGMWAEKPCTCGRAWPLLKEVTGRVTDIIVTKDGTLIHGSLFTVVHFFQDWIRKYQVIQEDYDLIRILIVPYEKVNNPAKTYEKEIGMLTEKIRLAMDRGCHIKYEFVNDIAPTSSGKYRYIISKVKCNDK